jgi:hypothetical protein
VPTHSPLRLICSGCRDMVRLDDVNLLQQVVRGRHGSPIADVFCPRDVLGQFNSDCALQYPRVREYVGPTSWHNTKYVCCALGVDT